MSFLALGTFMLINFSSCSKEEENTPGNTFKVRMTDAPGDFVALEMEIVGVDIYHNTEGWINLSSETQMISVLDLTNGQEIELAHNTAVNAGLYTKIRIRFGDNNTLTLFGEMQSGGLGNIDVSLAWNGPKEAVIEINREVSAESGADVLVDFHVAESVSEGVSLGEYVMHPVITEIRDAQTGIQGKVEGSLMAAILLTNGENTYSTYIDASDNFMVRGIEPGTYDMTIIPNRFDPDEIVAEEKQINNIVILQGEIKQMGTIQL